MRSAIIVLTTATLVCGCGVRTADNSGYVTKTGVSQAAAQTALYNAGYRNVAIAPDGNGGWVGTAHKMSVAVDSSGTLAQR
jgi:hypothetical protein